VELAKVGIDVRAGLPGVASGAERRRSGAARADGFAWCFVGMSWHQWGNRV